MKDTIDTEKAKEELRKTLEKLAEKNRDKHKTGGLRADPARKVALDLHEVVKRIEKLEKRVEKLEKKVANANRGTRTYA